MPNEYSTTLGGKLRRIYNAVREAISIASDLVGMGIDLRGWILAAVAAVTIGGYALRQDYVVLAVVGMPAAVVLWLFVYQLVRWNKLPKGVSVATALSTLVEPQLIERRDLAYSKLHWLESRIHLKTRQAAQRNRAILYGKESGPDQALDDQLDDLIEKKEWMQLEYEAANNALMADFYGKLFRGELVAHGFALPHAHNAPSLDIPALEWDFLLFKNGNFSVASGNNVQYHIALIRRA